MLTPVNRYPSMPPPAPPPPPRSRPGAIHPHPQSDVFESSGPMSSSETSILHAEEKAELTRLREENARLLETIEELRRQLKIYEADVNAPKESKEALNTARLELLNEIQAVEQKLETHHLTHASLIEASQDSMAIDAQMKAMGPKAGRLSAKMTLQQKAKDFEANEIAPLNLRHAELFKSLTKATLRLTQVSPHAPLLTKAILNGLEGYLSQPESRLVANQIKESVNTHPGQRAHDIKPILSAALLKFLETLRPNDFTAMEWSSYLGTANNPDCAAILLHYGIDSVERLTSTAEQHLTQLWKEEDKRIFLK